MLPKKNKINRKEFSSYRGVISYNSPILLLRVLKPAVLPPYPKFAFSVSKKAFKKASDRNTVRRRGYSALHDLLPHVNKGFSGVFSVRGQKSKPSFEELKADAASLLRKAGALNM